MVYAPQRRHVVASALSLMQHLYSANTLILIGRLISQAPTLHPLRSLFSVFFWVTLANLAAGVFHLLDFAGGMNGSKGLILDFVGQSNPASLTRILLLDLGIYLLQVLSAVVCYVVNYSPTLPKSDLFPYDDLLLPPDVPQPVAEDGLDLERGDQFRQRRLGKGPRYHHVSTEVWLDEEDEDDESLRPTSRPRLLSSTSPIQGRRKVVPLIFTLSLSHLVNLVFRLPAPSPARAFVGGTPATTPPMSPRTPAAAEGLTAAPTPARPRGSDVPPELAQGGDMTGGGLGTGTQDASPLDTPGMASSEEARSRRIPGDYWTSRTTG